MDRKKTIQVFEDMKRGLYPMYPDEYLDAAIESLSAEPCEDAISRSAAIKAMNDIEEEDKNWFPKDFNATRAIEALKKLPSVTPKQKMGRCKDCKYFEYNSIAKVDGIPLIVAHEICSKWGDGCKTSEDGYCFLYEPQESED